MRQKTIHTIITILFFITGIQAIAQTYPVQAIPQVQQPPAVYLSDYASTNNTTDRIKLQLLLTDLTVINREVKLKLYIDGNGIEAQSSDFVIGSQPLFLEGGIPLQLGGIDLAPYFELQNLKGISAGAYANTLPDGLYQFCFEVYDVLSGNVISRKSCANVLIFLNDPPFLNLPENQANIDAVNPQNILFQWTPRQINVSNVEYEFSLVEIHDNVMSPEAVFVSSPIFYQTTTQSTTFLYGLAEPPLLEGTRYAWRVQAKAKAGVDEIGMFKNNGYSEIFSFTYQGECEAPAYLTVEDVTSQNATFKWQGGFDHSQYKIAYRKAIDNDGNSGQQNSFTWFESTLYNEEFTVIDLEPNTLYEWRVGGFCTDGSLSFSDSKSFTTMETEAEAYYNCGIAPDINIANTAPKQNLQKGEVIKAGDFNVKITEANGSGSFSGKGYTTVGFLKNLKIALTFENIKVNTDNQLIAGEIKTVYDPTWGNILDIDEVIDEAEDIVDVVTGGDDPIITLSYNIDEDDITVDADAGKIIIQHPDGTTRTYGYDKNDTYKITDASGDEFTIDKDGKVTQTGDGAPGGRAIAENTKGITDGHKGNVEDPKVRTITNQNITFTFSKGKGTEYELDIADNDFEKAGYHKVTVTGGTDYYPVHKAVAEGTTDVFYVDIKNNNTAINTDSLIFKKVSGSEIKADKDGKNRYKITVKGDVAYRTEEVIITYKTNDTVQQVLTSFFIHQIKKQETINVNVVYVNGANPLDNLKTQLNTIYNPAGASFKVGSAESINIDKAIWDIDVDNEKIDYNGSGLDSDYPKELNAIKNYYKDYNKDYDKKAYYLFVLDKSMPATKAISGFMPKTRQWGFLFEAHYGSGLENKESPEDIAAHELGHGVFALGHPFDDPKNAGVAHTWLMDYRSGTELAYPNWAEMSSDALKLYLFQDDEGSEQITTYLSVLSEFGNKDSNNNISSYSFVSPSNKIVSIPPDAQTVIFSTYDPYFNTISGESTGNFAPMGSLIGFTKNNNLYTFKGSGNNFSYICDACINDKIYRDIYTKDINDLSNAITALPYLGEESKKIELYANKIQIDATQIINIENGIENFGGLSEEYSIIKELNNPETTLGGYYAFFENGKGKKITQTAYTELTPYAIEFLSSFEKNLTSEGSIFSPVLVSTALAFSKNEALENLFKCEVLSLKYDQKRSLEDLRKSNADFLTIVGLTKTYRIVRDHAQREAEFKQLVNYYHKLRDLLKSPQNITQIHKSINEKISSISLSSGLIELINSASSCGLENITFENRITALKKILKDDNSFFNDEEEVAILNLINAVTYNSQSKQLLTELFDKENSKLFRNVWKNTNFSEYNQYINKITEIYEVDQTGSVASKKFEFKSNQSHTFYDYNYSFKDDGSLNISETLSTTDNVGVIGEETYHFDSLNELVEVTFTKGSYIEYDIDQEEDVIIKLPAYYLAYLINNKKNEETITAVRILGNLVAILTSIPSGGQSITAISLVEGISLGIASADLVMIFAEPVIKEVDGGQEFIEIWTYVTFVDAGIGIARLGNAVTKSIVNGATRIKFNFSELNTAIKNLDESERLTLVSKFRSIPGLLSKLGYTSVNTIFITKILSQIEASIIKSNFKAISNIDLKFTNWVEGGIEIGGKNYKILELSYSSNGGFAKFLDFRATVNSGDELIGTIDNIRYQKLNSNNILEGNIEIYRTSDGIIYISNIRAGIPNNLIKFHDDLLNLSISVRRETNIIKYILKNDDELASIIDNKFVIKKWTLQRKFGGVFIAEADGYRLIENKGDFGFELGYKSGRKFSSEYVNNYHKGIGNNEPYKSGTQVFERELQIGDKVYIVENQINSSSGLIEPNPGGWGSKNKITTENELRQYLAVLEEWKSSNGITDPLVVREYTVKKAMPVRDGVVGPQLQKFPDGSYEVYYGGEQQYEFIEYLGNNTWGKYLTIKNKNGIILK